MTAEVSGTVEGFAKSEGAVPHRPHPSVRRPQDAATLILLDHGAAGPRVLLGKRHTRHAFMPGKYVFPGGRVDPGDGRLKVAGQLAPDVEGHLRTRVSRASPARARAYALAAVRELAEETGLLLGRGAQAAALPRGPAWATFASAGLAPCLEGLRFVARAITPPGRPRRYDTRFFVAESAGVAGRVDGMVGPEKELVELVWVGLEAAAELDLPDITRKILRDLRERLNVGLEIDQPVPFYCAVRGHMLRDQL